MPRKPDGPTARDTFLRVRLTSAQKRTLEESAASSGMSVSAYVRRRLLGRSA